MSLGKFRARAKERRQGHYLGRVISHGCFGELTPLGTGGTSSSGLVAGGVITQTPTLEMSAINLLLQSADFNNASWVKTNAVIVADSTTAPNGVVEADTLNDNSAAAMGEVRQNVVIPNDALTRVFSVYITGGTSAQTRVRLLLSGGTAVDQSVDVNPTSGTIITQSGSPTVQAITINGVNWFRVSIPATNNTSGNVTAQCIINPASASVGTQATVIAWGAQLETLTAAQVASGSLPTSQIPTTTAQVTRTTGKIPNWEVEGTMPQGVSIDASGIATGFKQPTWTILNSGSGNYTTPTGCKRIKVRMVGGGAGGAGSGAAIVNGTAGNNTTFDTVTCNGGGGGTQAGGTGAGTVTGTPANGYSVNGATGNGGAGLGQIGGGGGSTPLGGGGGGSSPAGGGFNAPANSGAGGGGGTNAAGSATGGGGQAGGWCEFTYSPGTYAYGVAATATGGAGTVSTGGTGAGGKIIIEEFYQ